MDFVPEQVAPQVSMEPKPHGLEDIVKSTMEDALRDMATSTVDDTLAQVDAPSLSFLLQMCQTLEFDRFCFKQLRARIKEH